MVPADEATLTPAEVRRALIDRGWGQGSLLPPELAAKVELIRFAPEPDEEQERWYIVVSQDCDVVAGSFTSEPAVEVAVLEAIPATAAVNLYNRSPRELHLNITRADRNPQAVRVRIWNRGFLSREHLLRADPSGELRLTPEQIASIVSMFGRRYDRIALPDALVERLKPAQKRLKRFLEDHEEKIADLLIGYSPEEELNDLESRYKLSVYVLLNRSINPESNEARAFEKEARRQLLEILGRLEGISLQPVLIVDPYKLTLGEWMNLVPLDFEALSTELTAKRAAATDATS